MNKHKQITFATTGFERHAKTTWRAAFLSEMEQVVPWVRLCSLIEPHYPKGEGGRPTVGLERMLRMYFVQQWFNLSDPAVEDALYDSVALRQFVGIDLGREPAPDETTICKFRHLLERHGLARRLLAAVNTDLEHQGVKVSRGTIVDASIIQAPSSTKNELGERDPEMHQTKKGEQWYFGMKAHVGVDSKSKLVHSVVASAANVHDSRALPALLHGNETRVWGDSAYTGQRDIIRARAPKAKDFTQRRAHRGAPLSAADRALNRSKAHIRAKVEHVFGIIKRVFGFTKVRYRGIAKNEHRLVVACALANIYLSRKRLLRPQTG